MPMSASCVVNRAELLDMLSEVREALPGSLAQAQELLGGREQVVAEARQEAQRIIDAAHDERGSLISGTEVARGSQDESDRLLAEARREAAEIRAEADDYVDSKLANFEVVLSKTIGSVDRGRDKLLGRAPAAGPSGDADPDAPDEGAELDALQEAAFSDPEVRRQRAEEYIEAQFRAFEAVLAKTLKAVGRGRQKLTGYQPSDELGAHMAAQDGEAARNQVRSSDADFLAGLAESPADSAAGIPERTPPPPSAPPQPEPSAAYQQEPYQLAAHQQSEYQQAAHQQPEFQQAGFPQEAYPAGYAQDPYALPQQQAAHTEPHASFGGQHGAYGYDQGYSQHAPQHQTPYLDPPQHQGYQGADYPAYPENGGYQGYAEPGYPGQPYQEFGYPQQGQPYPDQTYAGHVQQPGDFEGQYAHPLGTYDQDVQGGVPRDDYQGSGQQPSALDETSLFDTSMLDVEQLRRYEEGR